MELWYLNMHVVQDDIDFKIIEINRKQNSPNQVSALRSLVRVNDFGSFFSNIYNPFVVIQEKDGYIFVI